MKAKFVNESLNFQRTDDIKKNLDIGNLSSTERNKNIVISLNNTGYNTDTIKKSIFNFKINNNIFVIKSSYQLDYHVWKCSFTLSDYKSYNFESCDMLNKTPQDTVIVSEIEKSTILLNNNYFFNELYDGYVFEAPLMAIGIVYYGEIYIIEHWGSKDGRKHDNDVKVDKNKLTKDNSFY